MPDKLKKLFGWLDFGGTIAGVGANVLSTILTNRKNEQLAKMQNEFQKQENELAYQRAKPTNQVSQMMQAGMSKAGALNAINGGATYQPAPITSATAQAPQIDLSTAFDGLVQIGENAKQRKLQEDLQAQQIAAAERAQKAQFEENEKQREHDALMKDVDTANQTQHDYLEYEKHKENLEFNKQVYADAAPMREAELNILKQNFKNLQVDETTKRINNDLLEIQKQLQNDTYDYKVLREKAESLTIAATGELERLRASRMRSAILTMDPNELNAYMHYKARTELSVMIGDSIRDEQWSKTFNENKLKILKIIDLLVR